MHTLGSVGSFLAWGLVALVPSVTPAGVASNVYVDDQGTRTVQLLTWTGECNGPVTVTVELLDDFGNVERLTAQGTSTMVPDTCKPLCLSCPAPYAWRIDFPGGDLLAGGGIAGVNLTSGGPGAATLTGPFRGGVLERSQIHPGGILDCYHEVESVRPAGHNRLCDVTVPP